MKLKTTRMDVWSAEIDDKPGGLALTMRAIADYGADLECVIARRQPEKKGRGVLFVTPLKGEEQIDNASQVGLHRTTNIATLKIEGTDHPGLGAELAKVIGETGVNMHGLTAAAIGRHFVCYASFDSVLDMEKAETALHHYAELKHRTWRDLLQRKKEPELAETAG